MFRLLLLALSFHSVAAAPRRLRRSDTFDAPDLPSDLRSLIREEASDELWYESRTLQGSYSDPPPRPSGSPPTDPPATSAPTSTLDACGLPSGERESQIRGIFSRLSDVSAGTPGDDALSWLVSDDERFLCPDDPAIIERFAVAAVVYATEFENWTDSGNVLSGASVCDWRGEPDGDGKASFAVVCNANGVVGSLDFDDNNVGGTLPEEIGLLSGLQVLNADGNAIGGTLPRTLGQLVRMRVLDLDDNEITGTLPEDIFALPSLETLDLNTNLLAGTVPESMGEATSLKYVQLNENQFTGSLPKSLENLTNLGEYKNTFSPNTHLRLIFFLIFAFLQRS
mmetsp:Transcript_26334/g.60666  ORF Transcript_26334/g.60666 Transcript_26334/m.60666 type:complete len:339 (-) Transcript_26334:478-1494(-)